MAWAWLLFRDCDQKKWQYTLKTCVLIENGDSVLDLFAGVSHFQTRFGVFNKESLFWSTGYSNGTSSPSLPFLDSQNLYEAQVLYSYDPELKSDNGSPSTFISCLITVQTSCKIPFLARAVFSNAQCS